MARQVQKRLTAKEKKELGGCASIGFIIVCVVLIFILWPEKQEEIDWAKWERDKRADSIRDSKRVYGPPVDIHSDAINRAKQDLSDYGVTYYDVSVASSGCLWIMVPDNGNDRDGLAQTICYGMRRHYISCVTIVDKGGNTLGRSMCR